MLGEDGGRDEDEVTKKFISELAINN